MRWWWTPRASHRLAQRLIEEIRTITRRPIAAVVNTHHHWDHTWGNGMFRTVPIWGHENCARYLAERSADRLAMLVSHEPSVADELHEVEVTPPTRTLRRSATIDLGDRIVRLRHLGRGHTDNDVVVEVPDASVLYAGDLVVADTAPGFSDSFPIAWGDVSRRVAKLVAGGVVVPGHGGPLDVGYVNEQGDQLRGVASLGRQLACGEIGERRALREAPFRPAVARIALARVKEELA